MIELEESLKSLLQNRVHRFATCWKIERKDGAVLRLTDHNGRLRFMGDVYSPAGSFNASARQKQSDLRGQNFEILGAISSASIRTEDLRQGRYRGASITEYLVDWRYPWVGQFRSTKFFILETRFSGELWEAQVTGITRLLGQAVGDVYTRDCPFVLGDARCKVNLPALTLFSAEVVSAASRGTFTAQHAGFAGKPSDYWDLGVVTWTSGQSNGLTAEVKSGTIPAGNQVTLTLQVQMPVNIAAGDKFKISPGCDGLAQTCVSKFDNFVNFGGFLFIPGRDALLQTPE